MITQNTAIIRDTLTDTYFVTTGYILLDNYAQVNVAVDEDGLSHVSITAGGGIALSHNGLGGAYFSSEALESLMVALAELKFAMDDGGLLEPEDVDELCEAVPAEDLTGF